MNENISFTSILEESNNKLWGAHFLVPPPFVSLFPIIEKTRRVFCRLNDAVEIQCAILPFGEGRHVITINKKLQKQLNISFGDRLSATLRPDDSPYGLPMPEEFEAVLQQDSEGNRLFHALTAGKQRTLLYITANIKNSDARIQRALTIIEHLKSQNGKIDFKKLNEDLRNS